MVIDDDPRYATELAAYLRTHGCQARCVHDASEVEATIVAFDPSLILLDQRLGTTTGTDVLRQLRNWSNVPCIVVTAMSDPMDRLVNLEVGADDEVDKSVSPRELLARIRAVLRRGRTEGPAQEPASSVPMRGWNISLQERELRRPDGSLCHLTTAEFDTLQLLLKAAGRPVRRATICERVFGRAFRIGDRAVDTIVTKLRRKLEPNAEARCIKTVRPLGYVFTGFPEWQSQVDTAA
jgi:DNA-binding response OmpR family regulator